MEFDYFLAFTTGLLGGFGHCIGMCGPMVATYTLHGSPKNLLPHFLYNAGRVTTYVFIGSIMGITGFFVNVAGSLAGIQNIIGILAGLMMVFMGLGIAGLWGMKFIERHNSLILRAAKVVLEGRSVWRYYPLGILLGFLPCGLSYTIFIASAAAGSLFSGMFLAFCFGIGTIPAMVLFGAVITYMSHAIRGMIYRAGGIVVVLMGINFIYRSVVSYAKM
ncbi:MAG: sulfite exporter TauE/SafE family protein [Thermodesulfovibrionales bacterium]|nr:sulfite exporter TauE/SafE family protein [Thermodesulfovibrionales bacterium]